MNRVTHKPVLLVEDSKIDILNVRRAFSRCNIPNPLHVARTGDEAFGHLRGRGGLPPAPKPGLILLDLNMPVMNGFEFLSELKQDRGLRGIPVVILSSSAEEGDLARSFDLGVAGFFTKPIDCSEFVEIIRTITLYWNLSEQP